MNPMLILQLYVKFIFQVYLSHLFSFNKRMNAKNKKESIYNTPQTFLYVA